MGKRSDAKPRSGQRILRFNSSLSSGRRLRPLRFELMEGRRLLSVVPGLPAAWQAHTTFERLVEFQPSGASGPTGLTPNQVRGAYGLGTYDGSGALSNAILFHGIQGDGSGQTIAIVDAYDNPTALSDLNFFSAYYNLPQFNTAGGPTFKKLNQYGGTALPSPAPTSGWAVEEALDVQWAHAMAPMANIILFEANTASTDLYTAVQTAANTPGVIAVSMSWTIAESSGETSYDSIFTTPAGHLGGAAVTGGALLAGGVTFLAATGDAGAYAAGDATITPQYPASSPNVIAVGGTSLYPSGNDYGIETAWGNGANSWKTKANGGDGGGGGISSYEPQPAYQAGVVNRFNTFIGSTQRVYPDVSADANPYTGVPIYDSYDFPSIPWQQYGGTSLACPLWAGMVAVADQGRAIAGLGSLDGATQTLPALYTLPAAAFHDIAYDTAAVSTPGNSLPGPSIGPSPLYDPGPGYDLATGLGSPAGDVLIPELAGPSMLAIIQGPTDAAAGAAIAPSITVEIKDAAGNRITSDNSIVMLRIGNNPSGGNLLGTRTVAAVNGVATFSGLGIDIAGVGYTLVASDGGLSSATSAPFDITHNSAQPTVDVPANLLMNPVGGKTAELSVLGGDPTGESNLIYTWSAVTLPDGAASPTFSGPQGTNAAKGTTATFSSAGTYVLLVTITNGSGFSNSSSVSVTVSQTFTSLAITPGPVTLSVQSQVQFAATELDQFGNAMGTPPAMTWIAANGTISSSGLYTPPSSPGSDTVMAQSGEFRGAASVTIVAPVGWWKFDEGSGTNASDSAADPDNGVIANGVWLQPRDGTNGTPALEFNGTGVVNLGNPTKLSDFSTGEITLSAWIKPASINAAQYVIDHRQFVSNNDVFLMITSFGAYEIGFLSNAVFHGTSLEIPSQDLNSWVHLAGTFDGQTWRLYRNGQLVASTADSTSLINPPGKWGIGAATNIPANVRHFNGAIDDVRIYNTAISSAAIPGLGVVPPPMVSSGNGGAITFVRGGLAVAVVPNLIVTDPSYANLLSATVALNGGPLDAGAETLAANTTGTNITASYNSASGVLSLNGSDTLANYQQVLRSVTYIDTQKATTNTGNRMLSITVSDLYKSSVPLSSEVAFDVAPQVVGVYVSGTAWNPAFFNVLAAAGAGNTLGFELADGAGQLSNANAVGWVNVDTISIVFSKPVRGVTLSSLLLGDSGNNGGTPSGISVVGQSSPTTTVATFKLSGLLTSNKYYLALAAAGITDGSGAALDGEWGTGTSVFAAGSGDGASGGDFDFRFNVLAGDVNGDGQVSTADVAAMSTQALSIDSVANWRYDINGDGKVSAADLNAMRWQPSVSIDSLPEPIVPTSGNSPGTAVSSWTSAFFGQAAGSPGPQGAAGDSAVLDSPIGGTVNLDGVSPSLADLTFNSTGSYTIAQGSGGLLQLVNSGNPATLTVAAGSDTISAPVALESSVVVLPAAGSQLTISGAISGAGGFSVSGQGTVFLSGENSYTGGTTVTSGTLILDNPSAIATSTALTVGADAAYFFDPPAAPQASAEAAMAPPMIASAVGTTAGNDLPCTVARDTSTTTPAQIAVIPATSSGLLSAPPAADLAILNHLAASSLLSDSNPSVAQVANLPAMLRAAARARIAVNEQTDALHVSTVNQLLGDGHNISNSKRIARDLAWVEQAVNSSESLESRRRNEMAILALEAMFAQYGR